MSPYVQALAEPACLSALDSLLDEEWDDNRLVVDDASIDERARDLAINETRADDIGTDVAYAEEKCVNNQTLCLDITLLTLLVGLNVGQVYRAMKSVRVDRVELCQVGVRVDSVGTVFTECVIKDYSGTRLKNAMSLGTMR